MGVKDTVLNKTEFNRHFKQRAWSLFVCLLLSLLKASLGHGGTSGSPSRLSIQHRMAWPQLSTDSTPLGCFHRGRWTCTMQDTCAASQPSDCYSSSGISGSLPQKSEITAQFVHMSSAGGWWMCAVCLACGKLPKKQLSTGYFDISKCFSLTDLESLFCELCSLLLVHLHKLSAAPVPPGVWGQAGVPAPFLRCLPCCPCPAAPRALG